MSKNNLAILFLSCNIFPMEKEDIKLTPEQEFVHFYTGNFKALMEEMLHEEEAVFSLKKATLELWAEIIRRFLVMTIPENDQKKDEV